MKCIISLVFCLTLLFSIFLFTACTPSDPNIAPTTDSAASLDNPLFEPLGKIEQITISTLGDAYNWQIIYHTQDASQIDHIVSMFDGWYADQNIAQTQDTLCYVKICFDDKLTIDYGGFSDLQNLYYGYLGDQQYYGLPKSFGQFLDSLTK